MKQFTHTGDGKDWSEVYPYHVIAYQFAKRIMVEYRDTRDLIEDLKYTSEFSARFVITPNGNLYKKDSFIEKWEIAVGLVVPEPTTNIVRTLNEWDRVIP